MTDHGSASPLQADDRRALLARLLAEEAHRPRTYPLSLAQQRLWFLDQLSPGSTAYNVVQAFRLSGELDTETLRRSLATIVQRQASLRTTIEPIEGSAVQVVHEERWDGLAIEDLSGLPGPAREAEARRRAAAETDQRFDLETGPLFRATLLRLSPRDHVLVLSCHHIVSDGWSLGVLLRELGALYPAYLDGRPSPLDGPPIQYGDFATWQRDPRQEPRFQEQMAYWRDELRGASPLHLLADHPRPPVETLRGRRLDVSLGRELSLSVRDLSRRLGLTPFMTLLAAFQALLGRYTGQADIVVGTVVAGRSRRELEGLVGFFVNTLPLRTDLSGDPTFRELTRRVRQVAVGAFAHQEVPFERLVDELQPERSLDRNPLFQVAFALQGGAADRLSLPGLSVSPFDLERTTSKLDLTLSLEERPDGLGGFVEFNTDLFEASTIAGLLDHYLRRWGIRSGACRSCRC